MLNLIAIILILLAHFALIFIVQAPIDFYYLGVVYLCALTFIRLEVIQLRKVSVSLKQIAPELIIFCSTLILGYFFYRVRSVWLDEYTQADYARSAWKCLSCGAAHEQQPPLSYALSSVSLDMIGRNIESLRYPSILFFAFSAVSFWGLLKKSISSLSLQISGIILYSFHVLIFYFITEARPYALFLCLGLMYLQYILKAYLDEEPGEFYQVGAIGGLLLLSIGLQSEVLLLASIVPFIFLKSRMLLRPSLLSACFAIFFFLPILFLITSSSLELQQFNSGFHSGYFTHLLNIAGGYFKSLFIAYKGFALDIALGLSGIIFLASKKAFFWLSNVIAFSAIFIITYSTFINWNLHTKYFIIIFPLLILLLLMGFEELKLKIYERLPSQYRAFVNVVLFFILFVRLSSYILHWVETSKPFSDTANVKWKSLYYELDKELRGDDRVYTIGFNQLGEWGFARAIGVEFYLPKKTWQFISNPTARSALYFESDSSKKGTVFLIIPQYWSVDTLSSTSEIFARPNIRLRHLGRERVIELTANGKSQNQRLIDFFESIVDRYGKQPWTLNVWGSLAKLYGVEDMRDKQLNALQNIVKLPFPIGRNLTGSSLDYQKLLGGFLFEVTPSFVYKPGEEIKAKRDEKE